MEKRIKAYLLLTEEWLQRENLHRNIKMHLLRIGQIVHRHDRNGSRKGVKKSNCTKFL